MKLGRRKLLFALPFGLVSLTCPLLPARSESFSGRVSVNEKQAASPLENSCGINADDSAREKINKYNAYLNENPDFNWAVHNELRHLYITTGDERSSLEHCDILLHFSLADEYILNILSGWKIGHDSNKAISNLLYYTKAYPDLKYLEAACFVEMGDLYAGLGNRKQAREVYLQVIELRGTIASRYAFLAQARLETLEHTV